MSITAENERSRTFLQDAGFRPTRQRMALASLLFDGQPKHMTAEQVHAAMRRKRSQVSLATVYNALNQFTAAGLLREVMIDPARVYFDTHTAKHYHFFDASTGQLYDIPEHDVRIARLPKLPDGRELDRVDIVIRVCRPEGRKSANRG